LALNSAEKRLRRVLLMGGLLIRGVQPTLIHCPKLRGHLLPNR